MKARLTKTQFSNLKVLALEERNLVSKVDIKWIINSKVEIYLNKVYLQVIKLKIYQLRFWLKIQSLKI